MADLDPREYYAEHAGREFERLTETLPKRLEFEHTVATLEDVLPADGRVLDAGGDLLEDVELYCGAVEVTAESAESAAL